ncbi:unnamed protein product [Mycena citricolor]|uniref:Myb/SANT-like domain-containing protein n=1 Tax=Mycena citricolor TaxID=2018698 RepID=A0AAD2JW07_9AGAR|nr:unnamed protein product [Mycena citricolor]
MADSNVQPQPRPQGTNNGTKKEPASWTDDDVEFMVDYLIEHASEGSEGLFSSNFWRAFAVELNKRITEGGDKTGPGCSQKYSDLRALWFLVDKIKKTSGYSWNDETGVTVVPAMVSTWDDWVKIKTKAKRFRRKGWPYHEKMSALMPSKAKGTYAFHAGNGSTSQSTVRTQETSQATTKTQDEPESQNATEDSQAHMPPAHDREPSPAWDEDKMDRSFSGTNNAEDGTTSVNDSPVPKSALSRKRVPAQATPAASRKRLRPSSSAQAAERLNNLVSAAADMNGLMRTYMQGITPTGPLSPERRRNTNWHVQGITWLDGPQKLSLISIFRDVRLVDEYFDLEDEGLRIEWIMAELGKLNIFVIDPCLFDTVQ